MPGIVKIAAIFRPKRNWKPKRRDRNISRRKGRKAWWRRNKNRVKLKRNRRRKMLKHNSMFKAWRKKRQKEKGKRRMRFGAEGAAEKIAECYRMLHWIESNVNEKLIFEQLLLSLADSDTMLVSR